MKLAIADHDPILTVDAVTYMLLKQSESGSLAIRPDED
jgi:hypothetical protein